MLEGNFQTGGYEYYTIFSKGNHELRKVLNDESDYEVVFTGHHEKCADFIFVLLQSNIDYDYNL